jgi:hypothetical protein
MRNPLRRQRTFRVPAAVAALVIAAACTNAADPTSNRGAGAPQAQPGQRPLWDGRWTGQTVDGQLVTFTILGNEITDFSIAIDLAGDCHIGIFRAIVSDAPDAVVNQHIVVGDSTSAVTFQGELTADATAAGSVVLNYAATANGVKCNSNRASTWTASRNW